MLTVRRLLLTYFLVLFSTDVLEYYFDVPVWNQATRTATCYDWFEQYLEKNYDRNKDYSEGIFDGNFSMSLEEATINKYKYIYEKLGLEPGMRLLDAGCGTGKWMEYCRNKGVHVVGLTLSPEQAHLVRKKGLDVHVMDYRVLHEPFINQFDRISALGSSEHVCSPVGGLKGDTAERRCNKIRIDTWTLFYRYLKARGKCYITVLTVNSLVTLPLSDWMHVYIIERHYGGYYSMMASIENHVVPATGFTLTDIQDKTRDYHWSSVVDKSHFGYWRINWKEDTVNKITYIFRGIFTDIFIIHRWLYYFMESWMWQFGGYQEFPLTDEQLEKSPTLLKYFMLEKNN